MEDLMKKSVKSMEVELKEFDTTGKTTPEVLAVKLEGENAIFFRGMMKAVEDKDKKEFVKEVIKAGIGIYLQRFQTQVILGIIARKVIKK